MKKYLQIVFGIGVITLLVVGLISCGTDQKSPVAPEGDAADFLNYETSRNNSDICPSNTHFGIWVADNRTAFVVGFKTAGYHTIKIMRIVDGVEKPWTWVEPPTAAGQARANGLAKWAAMMHHFGVGVPITKIWVDDRLVAQWINNMMSWPTVNSCSITSDRAHPSTWEPPQNNNP